MQNSCVSISFKIPSFDELEEEICGSQSMDVVDTPLFNFQATGLIIGKDKRKRSPPKNQTHNCKSPGSASPPLAKVIVESHVSEMELGDHVSSSRTLVTKQCPSIMKIWKPVVIFP